MATNGIEHESGQGIMQRVNGRMARVGSEAVAVIHLSSYGNWVDVNGVRREQLVLGRKGRRPARCWEVTLDPNKATPS